MRVIWAVREGRQCALAVDEYLMGRSELPRLTTRGSARLRRILPAQAREPSEVPVAGYEHRAVTDGERRQMGVGGEVTGRPRGVQQAAQDPPVLAFSS